jgi:hypothetical protein
VKSALTLITEHSTQHLSRYYHTMDSAQLHGFGPNIPSQAAQNARGADIAPTASPGGAWICPLCNLRSRQNDASAFLRHLDQLHKDEADSRISDSPTDALAWQQDLVDRAFAAGSQAQAL